METPNFNHLHIYSSNDLLIDAVDSVSILHQLGIEKNIGHTNVDGRNQAPVEIHQTLQTMRCLSYQLMQDF